MPIFFIDIDFQKLASLVYRLFIKLYLTTALEGISLVLTSNRALTNLPIVTTAGHFVAPTLSVIILTYFIFRPE